MLDSVVRWQMHRLLAALVAVWVVVTCRIAAADPGRQDSAYAVVDQRAPATLCPGETRRVEVTLENVGGRSWEPAAKDRLSYHWRDRAGVVVVRDGSRTDLETTVHSGEQVTVAAKVTAPEEPGDYTLVWRMLREGEGWFPEADDAAASVSVRGDGPPLAWSIAPFEVPEIEAQGEATIELVVTNEGCATWSSETQDRLSYRWFAPDGSTKRGEGPRTAFDTVVEPGEETTVTLRVRGPKTRGRHLLRIAPVR